MHSAETIVNKGFHKNAKNKFKKIIKKNYCTNAVKNNFLKAFI